jgi:hypothetical protein
VPLEPYDIISDPKTVVAISLLYNSMVSTIVPITCLTIAKLLSIAMAWKPPREDQTNCRSFYGAYSNNFIHQRPTIPKMDTLWSNEAQA